MKYLIVMGLMGFLALPTFGKGGDFPIVGNDIIAEALKASGQVSVTFKAKEQSAFDAAAQDFSSFLVGVSGKLISKFKVTKNNHDASFCLVIKAPKPDVLKQIQTELAEYDSEVTVRVISNLSRRCLIERAS